MDINKAMEQTREEYSTGKKYETTYLNFKEDGTYRIRIVTGFKPLGNHWISGKASTCFGMHRGCKICVEVQKDVAEIYARQDVDDDEKKKLINNLPGVSVQMVCGVIDRNDGDVKIAKIPYSISKRISEWSNKEDYPFNKDGSPSFDIDVTKKTDGRTTYSADLVINSLNNELSEEEKTKVRKANIDPERFVTSMKKKAAQEAGLDPEKMNWESTKKKDDKEDKEELPVIQVEKPTKKTDLDIESREGINVDDIPF